MGINTIYLQCRIALLALLLCVAGAQVNAATIQTIQLLADDASQSLRISMDESAAYQVFNLEGPARLVLHFPAVKLGKAVATIQGRGGVETITSIEDSDGVRVEVGLAAGTTYNIAEKGNDLLLTFKAKALAQALKPGAVIQDIEVHDKGGITELVLRGRHMDANHNASLTNQGETMVLDFWGGKSNLPREHYAYASQRLNQVTVGAADGRLRLVLGLRAGQGAKHQIQATEHEMVVRFGRVAAKAGSGIVVEAVDFQPEDRVAHLVIRTNDANPVINLLEKDGKVILDMKSAHLAAGQQRSQDVRAFPGPVEQIDSYMTGKDVRIVARLRQKSVISSYQNGNVLTVTMKPQDLVATGRDSATAQGNGKVYTGQKVSFNYKDIDIRNALKLIAEMSNLNIIMSSDVEGVLTMRLVDVPWDQALDLILSARGLGKEKNGNVIRIAPLSVLKADATAMKEARKSAEDIAPLETEFITLGYASVNDVKTILDGGSVNAASGDASGGSTGSSTVTGGSELKLKSSRGSIMLDERSNTMIITDTRERLDNIKRLIAVIDKPMQQVMVEARIVEATDTFSRDLGVRWGGKYTSGVDRNGNVTNQITHGLTGGIGGNVVDLGAAVGAGSGGAIGYTLGTFSNALNLNLELSAAEQEGRAKVISSPRVFTSNLHKALIKDVQQVAFDVTTTSNGVTTITPSFIPAELSLEVTPQITADKRIIMTLVVNKGTPITNAAGTATSVTTKTVETKLLVKNGDTIVLGGIYSETTSGSESGVPGFQDIPILGNLFKRKQKVKNRNELLIFITPTVIEDSRGALQ